MIGEPVSLTVLLNHLWQSTLFAALAGLLTLALRKNRAQVRYWLWFSASFKFLVPFAVLMSLGSHLGWAPAGRQVATQLTTPAVSFAIEEVTQPFPEVSSPRPSSPDTRDWIAIAIGSVWACGLLAIAMIRSSGWLRIRAAVRASTPWFDRRRSSPARKSGGTSDLGIAARESGDTSDLGSPALTGGVGDGVGRVPTRATRGLLEPGVIGIFRPVLLLPEGIEERLTPAQLDAVITHELCHVKRRDNLFASIHMVVEATFWFHPLVWWIGARLLEERERACDEAVLCLGGEPSVYAEAIVNVCKAYVESPLACVAGVTGSDLKKRIEEIMANRIALRLNFTKKAALAIAGITVLAVPIAVGMMNAPARAQVAEQSAAATPVPKWDVISIKPCDPSTPQGRSGGGAGGGFSPGTLTANCAIPMRLIEEAYGFFANGRTPTWKSVPIEGAPSWLNSERYTIAAKAESPQGRAMMFGPMMQKLLEERFKLKIRREIREVPVYNLTIAKGGPRYLNASKPGSCVALDMDNPPPPSGDLCKMFGRRRIAEGEREFQELGVTMAEFSDALAAMTGRNVIDKTGLSGAFDIKAQVSLPDEPPRDPSQPRTGPDDESDLVFAVVQKLGMKLESAKGPGVVYVIEHIERPSDNFEPPAAEALLAKPQQPNSSVPPAATPQFEVASIKPCKEGDSARAGRGGVGSPSPGRLNAPCVTVMSLFQAAYVLFANGQPNPNSNSVSIEGGPAWINSERYEINAKAEGTPSTDTMSGPMLQALLEDRFKVKVHRETREIPVYALTVAKGGFKLQPLEPGICPAYKSTMEQGEALLAAGQRADGFSLLSKVCGTYRFALGKRPLPADFHGVSLDQFSKDLGRMMDRPIIDRTGIAGLFDVHLEFGPDETTPRLLPGGGIVSRDAPPAAFSDDPAGGPSVFTAIQQQLGLKLEPAKGPGEFLVIDHVEKPSGN